MRPLSIAGSLTARISTGEANGGAFRRATGERAGQNRDTGVERSAVLFATEFSTFMHDGCEPPRFSCVSCRHTSTKGDFEIQCLESWSPCDLEHQDVVVLLNLTIELATDDPVEMALREYVRKGVD